MLIKLTHTESSEDIVITTSNDDPTEIVNVSFSPLTHKEQLMYELENSTGMYGHKIKLDSLNNLDLTAAVRSLPSFLVFSIEPYITASALPNGSVS
jgi:hypothetical protein